MIYFVSFKEIFSLLYPNEVDLWAPARICLENGDVDDRLFNEARSEITDQLTKTIAQQANGISLNPQNSQSPTTSKVKCDDSESPINLSETIEVGEGQDVI